jgi:nucleoid DNA-binding protein
MYEFITHISEQHSCTKIEAAKTIGMFTPSVIDALAKGKEILLVGFGNFSVRNIYI